MQRRLLSSQKGLITGLSFLLLLQEFHNSSAFTFAFPTKTLTKNTLTRKATFLRVSVVPVPGQNEEDGTAAANNDDDDDVSDSLFDLDASDENTPLFQVKDMSSLQEYSDEDLEKLDLDSGTDIIDIDVEYDAN